MVAKKIAPLLIAQTTHLRVGAPHDPETGWMFPRGTRIMPTAAN